MKPEARVRAIQSALERELAATHVVVVDHSASHAEHPGAAGGGHFEVLVVCDRFEGLGRVAAQRLVYRALADLMQTEIHALSMTTLTPAEWQARSEIRS